MMVDKCLRVNGGDGDGDLLIWNINWEVSVQGNQVYITDNGMVTDTKKDYIFSLGDDIVLGGGDPFMDDERPPASWYQVSSSSCPGPYFVVSMIVDH